jgi:hypothetical protein
MSIAAEDHHSDPERDADISVREFFVPALQICRAIRLATIGVATVITAAVFAALVIWLGFP